MTSSSHRFCTAPMMDWTDRHCRFFLRQISRRARLYTEMITAPALMHGDVPRHLDFDPQEHPRRAAARRQRSRDARACGEARRALGLRRDQPQLRLSVGARADRQLRRVPHGASRRSSRDCVRAMRDAVALPVTVKHRIGLDANEDYGFVRDFVGTVARGGLRRLHRARAQRGAEGAVAEGESRGAAAALRGRASAEARVSAA